MLPQAPSVALARSWRVAAALAVLLWAGTGAGVAAEPPGLTAQDPLGDWLSVRSQAPGLRDRNADMVIAALNFVGVAYQAGGNHHDEGFDCSGFTRHIFSLSLGLLLPRQAHEQAHASHLLSVERSELLPGDLVFFNTQQQRFSHVGIYVGANRFVHAPRSGSQVRLEDMGLAYWSQRFNGARRASPASQ